MIHPVLMPRVATEFLILCKHRVEERHAKCTTHVMQGKIPPVHSRHGCPVAEPRIVKRATQKYGKRSRLVLLQIHYQYVHLAVMKLACQ